MDFIFIYFVLNSGVATKKIARLQACVLLNDTVSVLYQSYAFPDTDTASTVKLLVTLECGFLNLLLLLLFIVVVVVVVAVVLIWIELNEL